MSKVEDNKYTEEKLKELVSRIKKDLNEIPDNIRNYENNYEFIANQSSDNVLEIGEIESV